MLRYGCLGIVVVGVLLIVIIVLALANAPEEEQVVVSTGNQTSSSTAQAGAASVAQEALPSIGAAARKGNWEITFKAQEKTTEIQGGTFGSEKAQGEFRILTLNLANVGNRSFPLNSHDFSLNTPDGVEYNTSSDGHTALIGEESGPEVLSGSETIQPGLSKDVRVVFDVPPNATGLILDVQGVRFAVPD
ncbi:MAG: DUF4352 domain-containing protein [Chloroflexi bacterium]|nr:DUF4352 domain-containing protein [Chloroflexota bacterium]